MKAGRPKHERVSIHNAIGQMRLYYETRNARQKGRYTTIKMAVDLDIKPTVLRTWFSKKIAPTPDAWFRFKQIAQREIEIDETETDKDIDEIVFLPSHRVLICEFCGEKDFRWCEGQRACHRPACKKALKRDYDRRKRDEISRNKSAMSKTD